MNINAMIADLEQKIARNRAYVENVLATARAEARRNLTISEDAECERRLDAMDADKQALERARKVKEDDEAADAAMNDTHPTSARSVAKSLLENWAEAVRRNVS